MAKTNETGSPLVKTDLNSSLMSFTTVHAFHQQKSNYISPAQGLVLIQLSAGRGSFCRRGHNLLQTPLIVYTRCYGDSLKPALSIRVISCERLKCHEGRTFVRWFCERLNVAVV